MIQTLKKLFAEYIQTVGKKRFILFLFAGFFLSILVILEPLFFAGLISYLENFLKTGIFNQKEFGVVLILWIAFSVIYIGFSYIYRFYVADIPSLKNHNRVFLGKIGDIFSMSYSEYLGKKTGSIYKNFDRGSGVQFSFIFFFFKEFLRSTFSISIIIIVLLFIDWKMTLISLSMLPIMVFFGLYFHRKNSKKQKELNKEWDSIFGIVGDFMNNFLLSKTLFLEKKIEGILHEKIQDQYKRQYFVSKGWSVLDVYTVSLIAISRILVMGFGVYFVVGGSLEFYQLFLFYSYVSYIYFPLGFLFGSLERIQKEVSEAERYYSEFEYMEVEKLDSGENLEHLDGNIDFKDVSFSYSEEKKILQDLTFSIKKGEKIAFVGNTGAGKSTIINLILRLWDVESGEILFDGKNIKDISKKSLREHIGIVTQEVGLYNDTLKQNLLYAKSDATDEELEEALNNAEAQFSLNLEKGLETVIGERGMKLSGGEKQRIAIARLFLKNPEVLILDEATSALDNKTEKLVQKALDALMKGKTSIIIAHRLSTIQNVDTIYMLENGKIIESGNYEALIKKGGKFAELADPEHLIIN